MAAFLVHQQRVEVKSRLEPRKGQLRLQLLSFGCFVFLNWMALAEHGHEVGVEVIVLGLRRICLLGVPEEFIATLRIRQYHRVLVHQV